MNNQFPLIHRTTPPATWPSWMQAAMLGGLPASWRAPASGDMWDRSTAADVSLSEPDSGGILGQLAPSATNAITPANGSWYRNSPAWVQSAMPLGTKVGSSAGLAEPAYQPWEPVPRVPRPTVPVVPLPGPDGWYYPGAQLDPTPNPPAKDFRTRLREALSDDNVRYYAGPGFYEALQKLALLTQLLPGSGSVQSMHDSSQAAEDIRAGDYGSAASHLGMGTFNAGLDWLPGGKVLTALLAGMGARTFPWTKLPLAQGMERAGRSVDEIWRATGLERGADGQWRFELSDKGYRVNPKAGILDSEGYRVAPLYEHHEHAGMQAAYPDLGEARSKIRIDPDKPNVPHFWPSRNEIAVEVGTRSPLKFNSAHVLQQLIARREGFARPSNVLSFMRPGVSYEQAEALANKVAGLIEANNAVERLYMPEKQRLLRGPQWSEKRYLGAVPRDEQIIRYYTEDR